MNLTEKDGFMWVYRNAEMEKYCSVEEWRLRTSSWEALKSAPTVEERKAILDEARKKLRVVRRKPKNQIERGYEFDI